MQRIGIYGGTFNPPHLGHIRAAKYALEALALDTLLVIPGPQTAHKPLPEDTPSDTQRLEMLRLALEGESGIRVSDMELQQPGPCYTWQTLETIEQQYPDAELVLLLGADLFLNLHSWREPQRILERASLAVFCRGEKGERERIALQKANMEALGGRVTVLQNPVTPISSSDIRRLLILGGAEEFLPPAVERYIRENGLYSTDMDLRNLPEPELERAVIRLLKPSRVAHVLGCRDTAAELARIYGANERDAARAGLLHDVTKVLDGPLQLTLCRAYGSILDAFSRENPKTLHALTGSLAAERIFGENEAVVRAIRSHTTGKSQMGLLEKILYVADYMEPNRDFDGVEQMRCLARTDIDKALKMGLEMTLQVLKEQKRQISPESAEALRWLETLGV